MVDLGLFEWSGSANGLMDGQIMVRSSRFLH